MTRGPIDWSAMTERPPIYDGVGPRTSALGNSGSLHSSKGHNEVKQSSLEVTKATEAASNAASNTQKRTSSLKRFPVDTSRDSSASEVTLGEDSLTAYIEPFGRALPPLMTCRPDSIGMNPNKMSEITIFGHKHFVHSWPLVSFHVRVI